MAHRFVGEIRLSCLILKDVMDTIYETRQHRLESWGQPFLFHADLLHNHALARHQRGAPLPVCAWDCAQDSSSKVEPESNVEWPRTSTCHYVPEYSFAERSYCESVWSV